MSEAKSKSSSLIDSIAASSKAALAQTAGQIQLPGLEQPVEVLRDTWGVPHIFAKNQRDLFFAQGFVQAQDRLWQMEVWRRQAEGRMSELGGPEFAERDKLARLVRYRGDWDTEWAAYGPDTKQIVGSFVAGVNAFIDSCADNLPIEFQLTGTRPQLWTPEVCLGRMAGFIMSRNAAVEVLRALLVKEVGQQETSRLLPTTPDRPIPDVDLAGMNDELLQLFRSLTLPVRIDLDGFAEAGSENGAQPAGEASAGSNNWALSGKLTTTGRPFLANDPHRPITVPSLRYIVHLVCPPSEDGPGWNVIGASEPAVPGVTTGHNDQQAWGVTIVGTDQQDFFIEETNPDDPLLYRAGSEWRRMEVESQQIAVRGESQTRTVELKYTNHGPVVHEDRDANRAISIRWAGSEPGGAGYLGSLTIDRAGDWPQFLEGAARWKTPSINLVYADVEGHIGWIAAALTPIRKGWYGILPVAGSSTENEWTGWLPTSDLPQKFDPPEGYVATANQYNLPPGYEHDIAFDWSPAFRFERIDEVLKDTPDGNHDLNASVRLQQDATSHPARRLIALLRQIEIDEPRLKSAAEMLLGWDCVLARDSAPAALYKVWEAELVQTVIRPRVPEPYWTVFSVRPFAHVLLDYLETPDAKFGADPPAGRDSTLVEALRAATATLEDQLGKDFAAWAWGDLHRAQFRHMLSPSGPNLTESQKALAASFDPPAVSRDGDGQTPLATGPGFDQTAGASFSHICDLGDWDRSLALNAPGQSGQPGSKHYSDLLERWESADYFPLLFSRQAIEGATDEALLLEP